MKSSVASLNSPEVVLEDPYTEWWPTQSWFLERVRSAVSQGYAACSRERMEGAPCVRGVHRGWIAGFVSRTLGPLVDEGQAAFSVTEGLWALRMLGDVVHLGGGYYLPRESRVTVLTSGWARIAGGLTLEEGEHESRGLLDEGACLDTLGRVVRTKAGIEIRGSEDVAWLIGDGARTEAILRELVGALPRENCQVSPDGSMLFYNTAYRRARTRQERWQSGVVHGDLVVVRSAGVPAHYFVRVGQTLGGAGEWHSVGRDAGRVWVIMAERLAGIRNRILGRRDKSECFFHLPDMLPDAWTAAIMACSSFFVKGETRGFEVRIPARTESAADAVLRSGCVEVVYE